jgi:hypothetical protein
MRPIYKKWSNLLWWAGAVPCFIIGLLLNVVAVAKSPNVIPTDGFEVMSIAFICLGCLFGGGSMGIDRVNKHEMKLASEAQKIAWELEVKS